MSTRKHMVELVLAAAAQGLGLVIAVVASCAGTAPVEARTPVLHLVTELAPVDEVDEVDDSIPEPEPEPEQGQRLPDARILPPPDAAPMRDAAMPPPSPPPPPPADASPDAAPILPPRVRVDAAVLPPPRER